MEEKMSIEGLIKYAKDEFGIDLYLDPTKPHKTFEDIFGTSFIEKSPINFIDIKKQLPENYQKILIKRQCSDNQIYPEKYETITFYNEPDVSGSGFGGESDPPRRTSTKDIIGWLPIEALDNLEVK